MRNKEIHLHHLFESNFECLNPIFELFRLKFDADSTDINTLDVITIYIREMMIFIPHMPENQ